MSLLSIDRNTGPYLIDLCQIYVCINDPRLVVSCCNYSTPWVNYRRVSPNLVRSIFCIWRRWSFVLRIVPSRGDCRDKHLIVHRPCTLQQLPVSRSREMIKGTRINQKLSTCLGIKHCQFRESDIVADGNPNFAKFCINNCKCSPWR